MQGADAAQEAPPLNSWDQVFREALDHAQNQVSFLRWRGTFGGVLPHGYDANAIAVETILEILQRQPPSPDHQPQVPPHLLPGELRRLVWRRVDRLHHRKENFTTVNEPDLDPLVTDDDGEPGRLIDLIPSSELNPLDSLLAQEASRQTERLAAQFDLYLRKEHRLNKLFSCLRSGISKPRDLARKLKVKVYTVARLRKLLQRRWAQFRATQPFGTPYNIG